MYFLLDIARFKYSQKTYGFNDLEHCIEVINVTNAYEQEKIKLLRLWTIETEKYNSEICQPHSRLYLHWVWCLVVSWKCLNHTKSVWQNFLNINMNDIGFEPESTYKPQKMVTMFVRKCVKMFVTKCVTIFVTKCVTMFVRKWQCL